MHKTFLTVETQKRRRKKSENDTTRGERKNTSENYNKHIPPTHLSTSDL